MPSGLCVPFQVHGSHPSPHASVTLEADVYKLHPCLSCSWLPISWPMADKFKRARVGILPQPTSLPGLWVGNGCIQCSQRKPAPLCRGTGGLGAIPFFSSLDLGVVAASLPAPESFTTQPHLSIVSSFHSLQSPLLECPLFPLGHL